MKTNILTQKSKGNDLHQEAFIINDFPHLARIDQISNCIN